jgi:SAM-dependent methyltransferase
MGFGAGKNWKNYILGEVYFFWEKMRSLIVDRSDPFPFNYRPLDASPEALERDVEYSSINAYYWMSLLPGGGEFLRGKTVLEIGPGINFGFPLILACHGAKVMVADKFLTPWNSDYHPKFYALLKERVKKYWPLVDQTALDMVLFQGQYPPEIISLCCCSLEELSGVSDESVDLVISNAVLEHLYDLPSAFSHLARITKPGGLGIHQVDFRDHRDISRPLEHLLFREEQFWGKFKIKHGEFGNCYRPQEMRELLEQVGFEVREFRPDFFTEEEYLAEFLRRLRQARKSRYCDYPAEYLRPLSGLFYVVKQES